MAGAADETDRPRPLTSFLTPLLNFLTPLLTHPVCSCRRAFLEHPIDIHHASRMPRVLLPTTHASGSDLHGMTPRTTSTSSRVPTGNEIAP